MKPIKLKGLLKEATDNSYREDLKTIDKSKLKTIQNTFKKIADTYHEGAERTDLYKMFKLLLSGKSSDLNIRAKECINLQKSVDDLSRTQTGVGDSQLIGMVTDIFGSYDELFSTKKTKPYPETNNRLMYFNQLRLALTGTKAEQDEKSKDDDVDYAKMKSVLLDIKKSIDALIRKFGKEEAKNITYGTIEYSGAHWKVWQDVQSDLLSIIKTLRDELKYDDSKNI